MLSLSKEFKKEIKDILIIFLCWSAFNILCYQVSFVPSESMRPTLLVSDIVVVNKWIWGVRVPTEISLPFFRKTIPGTSIPCYIKLPFPHMRLPKFASMKKGEVVIFYTPTEKGAIGQRQPFVKRYIAGPGDKVKITKGRIWVNGKREAKFNSLGRKMCYFVTTKERVYRFFERAPYNIVPEDIKVVEGGYILFITAETAAKLQKLSIVTSIKEKRDQKIFCEMAGIVIPKKGMKIVINAKTCKQYGYIIRDHEGHSDVLIKGGKLFINGKKVIEYTFRFDYIFVIGDNFFHSWDSRFWGVVPMHHVMGKGSFILLGAKDGIKGGEEWWRGVWIIPLLRGFFTWKRSFRRVK